MVIHQIDPVFDKDSRVLILGSFPSVKSRETGFYYSHPANRFWPVMAAVLKEDVPKTVRDKRTMLIRHGIALWDVVRSCEIDGSSDSSIRDVVVNDIGSILASADIGKIFVNGKTAMKYYQKYLLPMIGRDAVCLPSTSPANAAWDIKKLTEEWKIIVE